MHSKLRFSASEWDVNLFVLMVYGAVAGALAVAAGMVFDMIFWGAKSVDVPSWLMNSVGGATAGALLMTMVALALNMFGKSE